MEELHRKESASEAYAAGFFIRLKENPAYADLRYEKEDSIIPSTLIFVTRGILWDIYYLYTPCGNLGVSSEMKYT